MLDIKELCNITNRGSHSVRYHLYDDGKETTPTKIVYPKSTKVYERYNGTNTTCFANLLSDKKENNALNKICFELDDTFTEEKLDDTQMKKWLDLSKENGFLSTYTPINKLIKSKRLRLDMTLHKNNSLYVYLSTSRTMVSEPAHVKSILKLMEVPGMDYFTATLIASKLYMSNRNHHFLPKCGYSTYPGTGNVEETTIYTPLLCALKIFILTMDKVESNIPHWTGFSCNASIEKILKAPLVQDILKSYKQCVWLISETFTSEYQNLVKEVFEKINSHKDLIGEVSHILK